MAGNNSAAKRFNAKRNVNVTATLEFNADTANNLLQFIKQHPYADNTTVNDFVNVLEQILDDNQSN